MDPLERKSSFDQSSKEKTQKLQNDCDQSIITMEDLFNEFFFRIFDYLDGYEIYGAFGFLNRRFIQLLDFSALLLKLRMNSRSYISLYDSMMDFNRHQIFSINLFTSNQDVPVITASGMGPLFIRLESLVLRSVELEVLLSLLVNLPSLSRLFSLSIERWNDFEASDGIYRLIFDLPKLKFMKLLVNGHECHDTTLSSSAISSELSSIVYRSNNTNVV